MEKRISLLSIKKIIFVLIVLFSSLTFSTTINQFIHNRFNVPKKRVNLIVESVNRYSKEYHIDKKYIYAILWQESNFKNRYPYYDVNDVAIGMISIHKSTYEWLLSINKVQVFDNKRISFNGLIYHPSFQIQLLCFYLSILRKEYGDIEFAISRYNGNPHKFSPYLNKIIKKSLDIQKYL